MDTWYECCIRQFIGPSGSPGSSTRKRTRPELNMPVISRFYGIVIRLICAPALGPRFSAIYENYELIVDIPSLRIL